MKKAAFCDECQHREFPGALGEDLKCAKGHHPRFYLPKYPMSIDWGWKRRCDDFSEISDDFEEVTDV